MLLLALGGVTFSEVMRSPQWQGPRHGGVVVWLSVGSQLALGCNVVRGSSRRCVVRLLATMLSRLDGVLSDIGALRGRVWLARAPFRAALLFDKVEFLC